MESVTRTLYARGDLDLVLSSPVKPARLFSVRIAANAVLISIMALVLSAPFLDVLVLSGGPRWLAGFGVAVAVAVLAAALAVAITVGLFRLLGPRRTRLVAQVVAAVVGAAFAIGVQVVAIVNYGQFVQAGFLVSTWVNGGLPGEASLLWWPARAILGDWGALFAVMATAFVILAAAMVTFAPRLGEHSLAAVDLAAPRQRRRRRRRFVIQSPRWAMRRKEWLLLRRDPWLVSQTLTQLLYLVPPALLLSHNFANATGSMVVVVMVLVTVGGQLAGALAWLAISGEDAPDLVATAPLPGAAVVRAKVEAVMGALALVLGPLVLGLAVVSPHHAAFAAIGIVIAALSTVQIQLWFRAQARRSHFRRRHTSSRIATLAEAMTSFSWAAAAGLAAAGTWLAALSAVMALLILAGARTVSPRKALASPAALV
jgi:ABC-2 type transport system permease protein